MTTHTHKSVLLDEALAALNIRGDGWYIDATFLCERCHEEFCFTAAEQKIWYEDYGFYIDSTPKECVACRRELRRRKSIRRHE